MKTKNIILIALSLFVFTSCFFSFERGTDMKFKKRTIDGIEYSFYNQIKSEKKGIGLFRDSKLEIIIDYNGMDIPIHKTISKSDFEKKVDLKNIEAFYIDSVSFNVGENRDKIDLYYYFNPGTGKKQAVFTLEKVKNKWALK